MTDTPTDHHTRESEHDHDLILAEHRMVNDRGGRTRSATRATYVLETESSASNVSGSQPESSDFSQADENRPTRELSQERVSSFSDAALQDGDRSVLPTSASDDHNLTVSLDKESGALAANLHALTTSNGLSSPSGSIKALSDADTNSLHNTPLAELAADVEYDSDSDSDSELSVLSDGDFSSAEETNTSTPPSSNSSRTLSFTGLPQLTPMFALQGRNLRPRLANRVPSTNINKKRSYLRPRRSGNQAGTLHAEPQQTLKESLVGGHSLRHRPDNNVLPRHFATDVFNPSQEQMSLVSTESIIVTSAVREQTYERLVESSQTAENAAKPHTTMPESPEAEATAADGTVASIEHDIQSSETSSTNIAVRTNQLVPPSIRIVEGSTGTRPHATIAVSGVSIEWLDEHAGQFNCPPSLSRSPSPTLYETRPVRNVGKPQRLMNEPALHHKSSSNARIQEAIKAGNNKRKSMTDDSDDEAEPIAKRRANKQQSLGFSTQSSNTDEHEVDDFSPIELSTASISSTDASTHLQASPESFVADDLLATTNQIKSKQKSVRKPQVKSKAVVVKRATKLAAKPTAANVRKAQLLSSGKPAPYGTPPVWAQLRQQLCQALPYYRAYQSGAYSNNGVTVGHLIDGSIDLRDSVNDEVVITSIGGGRITLADGTMGYAKDHFGTTGSMFGSFEICRRKHSPIALIIGLGNTLVSTQLPHNYNVMGMFHVTDLFVDHTADNFKVWKVRLEKIDLTTKSWWSLPTSPHPGPVAYDAPLPVMASCLKCKEECTTRYTDGWTCLNYKCNKFLEFANGAASKDLVYNDYFNNKRTRYIGPEPQAIVPALPSVEEYRSRGLSGFEDECVKGIVCPVCRGCSRRIMWRGFSCEHGCGFTLEIPLETLTLFQALQQENGGAGLQCHDPIIGHRLEQQGPYTVHVYDMPGLDVDGKSIGTIHHYKANRLINKQDNGPDEMFQAMQAQDFGLERKPARLEKSKLEVLTDHFAKNWGAPYKYGVAVANTAFSAAPDIILHANQRLSWAGKNTIGDDLAPFNELLSIGYMEQGHIGYHDDGEDTLGPVVATLSLGCSAQMMFRAKDRYRRKSQFTAGKVVGIKSRHAAPCLQIYLEHGDLVVMNGYDIQRIYEHSVMPKGKLRFALTGRHIVPEKMPSTVDRELAAACATLPEHAKDFVYDGDINTVEGITRFDMAESKAKQIRQVEATLRAPVASGIVTVEEMQGILTRQLNELNASQSIMPVQNDFSNQVNFSDQEFAGLVEQPGMQDVQMHDYPQEDFFTGEQRMYSYVDNIDHMDMEGATGLLNLASQHSIDPQLQSEVPQGEFNLVNQYDTNSQLQMEIAQGEQYDYPFPHDFPQDHVNGM